MRIQAAIIGGTGVGERLADLGGRTIHVPTGAGALRGRVVELAGKTTLLVRRHGLGHKVPPHRVNYRAMALGMQALGVELCLATAAVGSLREAWPAGTFVIPHDFLDASDRQITLFDRTVVHTDFSNPLPGRGCLLSGANAANISIQDRGIYYCANGPRYETPHEVAEYAKVADVVGMTAATEAILMREAGIAYGVLCVVTNLACGISQTPLDHAEVGAEMQKSAETAIRILRSSISAYYRSVSV